MEPAALGGEAAGQGPYCRHGGSLPYSLRERSDFAIPWHLLALLTDLTPCFVDETKARRQFCEVKP